MTPSAVEQSFARLVARAGLKRKVRPHMLRHSFGTELANAEVGLDVVQHLMGHALITSTQIYLHPKPERLRDAVDRVSARVPAGPSTTPS
jgi:site-specific recombinase XerD